MSEERFLAIEGRMDALAAGQEDIRRELRVQGEQLRQEMGDLHENLVERIGSVEQQSRARDESLRHYMDVLHENLVDRIDNVEQQSRSRDESLRMHMGVLHENLVERIDNVEQQLRTQDESLRRHMGVLHEDLVDRIAALAPDFGPIRREFTEADSRLREEIDQRLSPLEATTRRRRAKRGR